MPVWLALPKIYNVPEYLNTRSPEISVVAAGNICITAYTSDMVPIDETDNFSYLPLALSLVFLIFSVSCMER
jgi:hypothetical protein